MRASELVNETIEKLSKLEVVAMENRDYEFSLGVNASKLLIETAYAKILSMEESNVSDR